MRQLVVLLFLLLTLTACDVRFDQVMQRLAGVKEKVVVLADKPFAVTPSGQTFIGKEQIEVLGDVADTCLVIKTNYPMSARAQMDHDFNASLQGAKITTILTDSSGKKYEFDSVGQAWNMYGAITSTEELSACVSCGCEPKIPVGTVITSIHIKSDKPIPVVGAYWTSTSAFDQ